MGATIYEISLVKKKMSKVSIITHKSIVKYHNYGAKDWTCQNKNTDKLKKFRKFFLVHKTEESMKFWQIEVSLQFKHLLLHLKQIIMGLLY